MKLFLMNKDLNKNKAQLKIYLLGKLEHKIKTQIGFRAKLKE